VRILLKKSAGKEGHGIDSILQPTRLQIVAVSARLIVISHKFSLGSDYFRYEARIVGSKRLESSGLPATMPPEARAVFSRKNFGD